MCLDVGELCGHLYGRLSEDGAQFSQPLLHLWDARQLSLQPLLLLSQAQPRGRVQLLHPPPPLTVELEQVTVEPPAVEHD